jgi:hypothetical protein
MYYMDQLMIQTASTAPDTGEIFRWLLAQVVGWLISHIQSVMAVLTLLAVIVVILLGGKSIWRFTRVTVDRVWRGLSAVGWRLKRGLSSRAAAGIGGEMMEMLLIEPVGEPLSDHELNNELAQLTQTVGRLDVCIVPAGSSLLPPDLSPSTPYIYLLRADVPIDILQQQLAAFRTHKVRPVSIEWPTLFETSTWSMQVRQFLDQLRQVHRDIAAAETNKKRIGRLYVGLKNVVGAASAWWSRTPKRSMWDYVVDPETQSQHAMSLSATSTRESELETSRCHYPPRSPRRPHRKD